MGKEAKIGAAVIMVLLITFGVVLARRLGGPETDRPTASAKDEDQSSPESKEEPASSKQTVVGSEEMPGASSGASGQWNVISVGDQTGQGINDDTDQAPPPSYMPNPPVPASADPYGRYGIAGHTGHTGPAPPDWQTAGTASAVTADGSQPYGPYSGQSAAMSPANQQIEQSATLRVLPAPGQAAQDAARDLNASGYTQTGTTAYPANVSTTTQVPTYQESSRYTYPAGPPPSPGYVPTVSDGQSKLDAENVPAPSLGENGEYEVQPNDSYWVISKKVYGSGAYFKALAEHNRDRVPDKDRLRLGDVVLAPDVSELEKTYPGLCPKPSRGKLLRSRAMTVSMQSPYATGRTYVVEEGDTLFGIAGWELGKKSRWSEIYELNRNKLGDDYDYLIPGTQLVLPQDASQPADSITSRPSGDKTIR